MFGFRMMVVLATVIGIVALVAVQKASADPEAYVVQEDDTLWTIAPRIGLAPEDAYLIYDANADVIDGAALALWGTDSNQGERLVPGTHLQITAASNIVGTQSEALTAEEAPAQVEPIVVNKGVSVVIFAVTVVGLAALLVVVIGSVLGYFVYLGRRPNTSTT